MKSEMLGVILLVTVGCAAPARPVPAEMDEQDRHFFRPAPPSEAREIPGVEEIGIEDALRLADRMNPRLESARREVDRAGLLHWQDSLFPNPSVFVEVEDFPAEEGRSLGGAERGFGISQTFPVGGRLGASLRVAEKRRDQAALRYLIERRRILTDVKIAFVSALAADEAATLALRTRDLARTFHDLTEERFQARAVPEMEVLKAAVHLARTEADLGTAESARALALRRLLSAIGSADLPVERLAGDLASRLETPSLEAIRGEVLAGHPAVDVIRREKAVAEAELRLARAERIPDVDLALAFAWTPDEDRILEGGLSVPLPLFGRNQGRVKDAEVRIRQADLAETEARTAIILRLEETYRAFSAAQDRVRAYEDRILPKAERALAATEEGHRAGKFSYLDVLDAQQTLEEVRRAYLSAREDLNLRAAELEGITGSPLKRVRNGK